MPVSSAQRAAERPEPLRPQASSRRDLGAARSSRPLLYLLAALVYTSFGALFQVFPPYLSHLEREFAVDRALASLTMTAFLGPVALSSFLLGALVDRHGPARVGRAGFALLLAGGLVTLAADSYGLLLGGRAIAGLGGGMVLLSTLKLLAARVEAARLGGAFGIFVVGLPVGTAISFDALDRLSSWRLATAVAIGLVGLAAAAFVALVPPGEYTLGRSRLRGELGTLLAPGALRRLVLLVVLGYTVIIAFTTWAPSRLSAYGHLATGTAALIASVLLVVDIPFAPLWGRVSDRLGRRKPFVVASFLIYSAGAFAVSGLAAAGLAPVLAVVVVMGTGCAMFFPVTLALPKTLVAEERLGGSYGLFLSAQTLGMAIGPLALGVVFDHGSTPLGLLVGLCYSRRWKSGSCSRSTGWWQVRQRPVQQRRTGWRSSTVCGSVRPAAGDSGAGVPRSRRRGRR